MFFAPRILSLVCSVTLVITSLFISSDIVQAMKGQTNASNKRSREESPSPTPGRNEAAFNYPEWFMFTRHSLSKEEKETFLRVQAALGHETLFHSFGRPYLGRQRHAIQQRTDLWQAQDNLSAQIWNLEVATQHAQSSGKIKKEEGTLFLEWIRESRDAILTQLKTDYSQTPTTPTIGGNNP